MAAGGGGGEVLTPRELAMEEMDPQPGVFSEAEILRMEIASLVNLLREKQSDVLSLDPETVRKITSLRSEIACQKLEREVPEVKRTVPRRRKKFSAVPRVGQKKEIMADQESMDLSNSNTQSVSSQVSCISEQMPERCEQKEIDSEKIKPASRFESNLEHVYLPYGGEDEGERRPIQLYIGAGGGLVRRDGIYGIYSGQNQYPPHLLLRCLQSVSHGV